MRINKNTGYDPHEIGHAPPTEIQPHHFVTSAAAWGIQPFVGVAVVGTDMMLGAMEVGTCFIGCVLSFCVGMMMIVPCTLIQKSVYGDGWLGALGKGTLLGILVAIPTPIPSAITLGLTVLGAISMKERARLREAAHHNSLNGKE
jgi:hypothetical protein